MTEYYDWSPEELPKPRKFGDTRFGKLIKDRWRTPTLLLLGGLSLEVARGMIADSYEVSVVRCEATTAPGGATGNPGLPSPYKALVQHALSQLREDDPNVTLSECAELEGGGNDKFTINLEPGQRAMSFSTSDGKTLIIVLPQERTVIEA